jgi:hypothetical protein
MKFLYFLSAMMLSIVYSYSQNVGIGTITPGAPLHIKGTSEVIRVEGRYPYLSLFDTVDGYRGYLWYRSALSFPFLVPARIDLGSANGSNLAVSISPGVSSTAWFLPNGNIGFGTNAPGEKLDVRGNMNISGLLKLKSNSGNSGEVLTSNGLSAPSWKATSHSNATRFAVEFTGSNNAPLIYSTLYNLDATNLMLGTNGITINRAGLYHFECSVSFFGNFSSAPVLINASLVFNAGFEISILDNFEMPKTDPFIYMYGHIQQFSKDIYVAPGTLVNIRPRINFSSAFPIGISINGNFTGYLISE